MNIETVFTRSEKVRKKYWLGISDQVFSDRVVVALK